MIAENKQTKGNNMNGPLIPMNYLFRPNQQKILCYRVPSERLLKYGYDIRPVR